MPPTPEETCEAHIVFPKKLWKDFIVFSKIHDTSASKLIRNGVRKMLHKPENEMEAIE